MADVSEPVSLTEHRATVSPSEPDSEARLSGKASLPEKNPDKMWNFS